MVTREARLAEIGAVALDLSTQAALLAGQLAWAHRDPFDRLLAAEAIEQNLVLVTTDSALLELPGLRTLSW